MYSTAQPFRSNAIPTAAGQLDNWITRHPTAGTQWHGTPTTFSCLDIWHHVPVTFDAQPTLAGPTLTLGPLVADDYDPLFLAASDPLIWTQHPEPRRYEPGVFQGFFAKALASGGALIVHHRATGEVVGSSRYYNWDAHERSIVIGYTFLVRRLWGGNSNGELKRLMLEHAFHQAQRVWFHIGADNPRSRRAIEKIGAVLNRTDKVLRDGVEHEYCYYRIDVPARR